MTKGRPLRRLFICLPLGRPRLVPPPFLVSEGGSAAACCCGLGGGLPLTDDNDDDDDESTTQPPVPAAAVAKRASMHPSAEARLRIASPGAVAASNGNIIWAEPANRRIQPAPAAPSAAGAANKQQAGPSRAESRGGAVVESVCIVCTDVARVYAEQVQYSAIVVGPDHRAGTARHPSSLYERNEKQRNEGKKGWGRWFKPSPGPAFRGGRPSLGCSS
ncbi:hypothetical protein CDD83_9700 [Cordyceps sp. RAO-2017]|nr:hypothetical protein CDD83_9700 [Cordyceps sp. RAO-2017]